MVQEIQMSEEPRGGPTTLRAPRGKDARRVKGSEAHQTWLLEDGDAHEGGFTQRCSPFQSSLNEGKHKTRNKKPGILRGIGYMFRFGKNRKDGVAPVENHAPITNNAANERTPANNQIPVAALAALDCNNKLAPPAYQPPPPLPPPNITGGGGSGGVVRPGCDENCSNNDVLSESTLECMRQQVLRQRLKVEAER
ncbi:hypothetical protein DOY81_014904 [Sarcophaga bullata]|nr:hypothetical protein DOY81_014904 [Sarcophaga bullata]